MSKQKAKLKVGKVEIKETVNLETGELVSNEVSTTSFQIESEPEYVKLYIEDIGRLNNIKNSSNKVLVEFIKNMGYNNLIITYKPIKEVIAEKLGISLETVNTAVKELTKARLFLPFKRGIYYADPKLFARGRWSEINKLRLTIDYNENGTKSIESNIAEETQPKLF